MKRKIKQTSPLRPECPFLEGDYAVIAVAPGDHVNGFFEQGGIVVIWRCEYDHSMKEWIAHVKEIGVRRVSRRIPCAALKKWMKPTGETEADIAKIADCVVGPLTLEVTTQRDHDAILAQTATAVAKHKSQLLEAENAIREGRQRLSRAMKSVASRLPKETKPGEAIVQAVASAEESKSLKRKITNALKQVPKKGTAAAAKANGLSLRQVQDALKDYIRLDWKRISKLTKQTRLAQALQMKKTHPKLGQRERSARTLCSLSDLKKVECGSIALGAIGTKGGPPPAIPHKVTRMALISAQANGSIDHKAFDTVLNRLYAEQNGTHREYNFSKSYRSNIYKRNSDLKVMKRKTKPTEQEKLKAATPEVVLSFYRMVNHLYKSLDYPGHKFDCSQGKPCIPARMQIFFDEVNASGDSHKVVITGSPNTAPPHADRSLEFHVTMMIGASACGALAPGFLVMQGADIPQRGFFQCSSSSMGDWTIVTNATGSMRKAKYIEGEADSVEYCYGTMVFFADHCRRMRVPMRIPPDEWMLLFIDWASCHGCTIAQRNLILSLILIVYQPSQTSNFLQIGDRPELNQRTQRERRSMFANLIENLGGITRENVVPAIIQLYNKVWGIDNIRAAVKGVGYNLVQHGGHSMQDSYLQMSEHDIAKAVAKFEHIYDAAAKGHLARRPETVKKAINLEASHQHASLLQVSEQMAQSGVSPVPLPLLKKPRILEVLGEVMHSEKHLSQKQKRKRSQSTKLERDLAGYALLPKHRRGSGPASMTFSSKSFESASAALNRNNLLYKKQQKDAKVKMKKLDAFLKANFFCSLHKSYTSKNGARVNQRGNGITALSHLCSAFARSNEEVPKCASRQEAVNLLASQPESELAKAVNAIVSYRVEAAFFSSRIIKRFFNAFDKGGKSISKAETTTTTTTEYANDEDFFDNVFAAGDSRSSFGSMLMPTATCDPSLSALAIEPKARSIIDYLLSKRESLPDTIHKKRRRIFEVARKLLALDLTIYGGFVRDIFSGDKIYDIDVACSPSKWYAFASHFPGSRIYEKTTYISDIYIADCVTVQLVDTSHFRKVNEYPADVDVGNLRLSLRGGLQRTCTSASVPSLNATLENISQRQFIPIEPCERIPHRMHKYISRGWKLVGADHQKYATLHAMRRANSMLASALGDIARPYCNAAAWQCLREFSVDKGGNDTKSEKGRATTNENEIEKERATTKENRCNNGNGDKYIAEDIAASKSQIDDEVAHCTVPTGIGFYRIEIARDGWCFDRTITTLLFGRGTNKRISEFNKVLALNCVDSEYAQAHSNFIRRRRQIGSFTLKIGDGMRASEFLDASLWGSIFSDVSLLQGYYAAKARVKEYVNPIIVTTFPEEDDNLSRERCDCWSVTYMVRSSKWEARETTCSLRRKPAGGWSLDDILRQLPRTISWDEVIGICNHNRNEAHFTAHAREVEHE